MEIKAAIIEDKTHSNKEISINQTISPKDLIKILAIIIEATIKIINKMVAIISNIAHTTTVEGVCKAVGINQVRYIVIDLGHFPSVVLLTCAHNLGGGNRAGNQSYQDHGNQNYQQADNYQNRANFSQQQDQDNNRDGGNYSRGKSNYNRGGRR